MSDLESVLGESLLFYLLGVDEGRRLSDELTPGQHQVIDFLRAEFVKVDDKDRIATISAIREELLTYIPSSDMTQANTLRITAGGSLPTITNIIDPVESELVHLARDIYPEFLFDQFKTYGMIHGLSSAESLTHPANVKFMRHALGDDSLTLLFPGAAQHGELDESQLQRVYSSIVTSTGQSGPVILTFLADLILKNAYERSLLYNQTTLAEYITNVIEVLGEVRRLAQKSSVDVPMVVCLSNINLPPAEEIVAGGITLRPVPEDKHLGILSIRTPVTVEVVTHTPLKLLSIEAPRLNDKSNAIEHFQPEFEAANKTVQAHTDLVRFALLLASPAPPYHASRQGSTRIFEPMCDVPVASMQNANLAQPVGKETTVEEVSFDQVAFWLERVQAHPHNLDIAIRRLLSATTLRSDPSDGLIDAVLAWENIFSSAPETTLRVCGSISYLLEPIDYTERIRLYDRLKKIYHQRSSIVHGKIELTIQQASTLRDTAVDIGLRSIRRLYEYPNLLSVESPMRGIQVLMGAATPR